MTKKLPQKLLDVYVKFRTSTWYVWAFATIILTWIVVNKTGLLTFDNADLTYLNLLLSVLAELQGVMLLIYTNRIADRNERADKQERHNVALILKKLEELNIGIGEISDELTDEAD